MVIWQQIAPKCCYSQGRFCAPPTVANNPSFFYLASAAFIHRVSPGRGRLGPLDLMDGRRRRRDSETAKRSKQVASCSPFGFGGRFRRGSERDLHLHP
jgi:hypothetical protein